ncbi:MAG: hypothetical protein LAP85_06200 [Acidobacteriia bacterium]|nr:hypothetical protein [Terriglobia bacterium]
MARIKSTEDDKLFSGIILLNAKLIGLILGLLMGLSVFAATNWLVLKGPQMTATGQPGVGPHLQLLSQYFIGYRVSFFGSLVGFAYGFAIGTVSGAMIGWIYNKIVEIRN